MRLQLFYVANQLVICLDENGEKREASVTIEEGIEGRLVYFQLLQHVRL